MKNQSFKSSLHEKQNGKFQTANAVLFVKIEIT